MNLKNLERMSGLFHSDLEIRKNVDRITGQFLDEFFYLPYAKQIKRKQFIAMQRMTNRRDQLTYGNMKVMVDKQNYVIDEQITISGELSFAFLVSYYEFNKLRRLRYSYLFDSITKSTHYLLVWPKFKKGVDLYYAKKEDIESCYCMLIEKEGLMVLLKQYQLSLDDIYLQAKKLRRRIKKSGLYSVKNRQNEAVEGFMLSYLTEERSQPIALVVDQSLLQTVPHSYYHVQKNQFEILRREGSF